MNVLMAAQITGKISGLSIAGMAISALMLILFPVFIILFFRSRLKSDIREVVFGALAYIVIALLLVNVIYLLVMMIPGVASSVPALVVANILVTVLPEIGALAVFLGSRKKSLQNLATYAEFGAGYVTVELIMVAATVTITNLSIAYTYNTGGLDALAQMTGAESGTDFSYVTEMIRMPFYAYLLSGVEGVLFAMVRIEYMVIMYMIHERKLPGFWYGGIVGLYVLVKLPSALADLGVIGNGWVDPVLVLICLGEVLYLFFTIKNGIPQEVEPLLKKSASKGEGEGIFSRKKNAVPHSSDQGFHK